MDFSNVPHLEAEREQIEAAVAQWRALRTERLAQEKVVAKLKEEELATKTWILDTMKAQQHEGVIIGGRVTGPSKREVHTVVDKEALINYIYEHSAIDLLQFRLSESAVNVREGDGLVVPGVDTVEVYDLFDRKV